MWGMVPYDLEGLGGVAPVTSTEEPTACFSWVLYHPRDKALTVWAGPQ